MRVLVPRLLNRPLAIQEEKGRLNFVDVIKGGSSSDERPLETQIQYSVSGSHSNYSSATCLRHLTKITMSSKSESSAWER